jgi:hypothetical protein
LARLALLGLAAPLLVLLLLLLLAALLVLLLVLIGHGSVLQVIAAWAPLLHQPKADRQCSDGQGLGVVEVSLQ